ncbi:MAG: NUDIX domain-containing protein [Streptosporangiaceae bacterium]
MADRDGNGWVRCGLGHRHWGLFGAAGLLAFTTAGPDGPSVLLQRRIEWSHHGGTWGLPGGARDSHETAVAAALREAAEECGLPPAAVRVSGVFHDDHGGWAYDTVLARADDQFAVHADSEETIEAAWVPASRVAGLDLHPGFAASWPRLAAALAPLTIIVDAANVMGSRPDGWWRDRAAAAARLRDQLAGLAGRGLTEVPGPADGPALACWLPDFVLVVEGAARPAADGAGNDRAGAGTAAGSTAGHRRAPGDPAWARLTVLAAPGSGDDLIADLAGRLPGRRIVVTADRELRRRCEAAGASVAGPGWLLGLLGR